MAGLLSAPLPSSPAPSSPAAAATAAAAATTTKAATTAPETASELVYEQYQSEEQLAPIADMIAKDLSEPYTVYTYRFFLNEWPQFCFLARDGASCVGVIICRADYHRERCRGYIGMLAVDTAYRKRGIGTELVKRALHEMERFGCDEVVLETEVTNRAALALYENFGFVRDKRLHRYYLNGNDAFRLKRWFS